MRPQTQVMSVGGTGGRRLKRYSDNTFYGL
jgi:hypothetical protein